MIRRISRWWRSAAPVRCTALSSAARSAAAPCLVPRYPGLLCALGLLATDLRYDYARTALQRGPDYDLAAIDAIWRELEQEADGELAREGIPPERRRFVRLADLRYAKQGFELTLEAPGTARCGGRCAPRRGLPRAARAALYICRTRGPGGDRDVAPARHRPRRQDRAAGDRGCRWLEARGIRAAPSGSTVLYMPTFRLTGAMRCAPAIGSAAPPSSISSNSTSLILSRSDRRGRPPRQPDHPAGLTPSRNLDTVTLELIKGAIQSARVEMEALIERSAMSPFIREKKDYFTAFFDRDGRLVVSTALPMAAGNLIDCIFERYPRDDMRPGDLYLYNDSYGSHGAVFAQQRHGVHRAGVQRGRASSPLPRHGDISGTSAAWCRARSRRPRPTCSRRASSFLLRACCATGSGTRN